VPAIKQFKKLPEKTKKGSKYQKNKNLKFDFIEP
jgi:hypothetical protein